jgi:peptidoglycan-N-acetylglucosamine deacetylase
MEAIRHIPEDIVREKPRIAISSDDGPWSGSIEDMLGVLNDKGVNATFFWITENARNFKRQDPTWFTQVLYNIQDNGHEIGFHGPADYSPTLRTRLITAFGPREYRRSLWELEELTGANIQYFRPHCLFQPVAVATARLLGLRTPIPDPRNYAEGDDPVEKQVEKFSGGNEGSILVFHDGVGLTRSISNAPKALPHVIDNLRAKGLEPTNISGLPKGSYRSF